MRFKDFRDVEARCFFRGVISGIKMIELMWGQNRGGKLCWSLNEVFGGSLRDTLEPRQSLPNDKSNWTREISDLRALAASVLCSSGSFSIWRFFALGKKALVRD
jgi:hypothetical protein